ncbi:MAG: restriction endonuclease subunit S [Betaproteobacteria bacterium]|jgi:Restriction endonuclease S subunits|nr:restriction endonuclease subunit S [Betaproteobacteria bacterium]
MKKWPKIKLGELLEQIDRTVRVDPEGSYRLLGVRLEGKGPFFREMVTGTETAAGRLNQVQTGDFIYSRLFAWRGALGVINDDLDGGFVSNEFPIFRVDATRLDTGYLARWFQLPAVWQKIEEKCTGSTPTTRNRFKEQFFFDLEIPLPQLSEQRAIVAQLDALVEKTRQVEAHLDAVEREAEHLLALRFRDAIADAPLMPMSKLAPLVRREQIIDINSNYPELGIRSFGKGAFHKPSLSGGDVGTKRLYRIESGDLLFSNVFAWEGAIAIAQAEDTGRFGSHRFITCLANPAITTAEFLRYYFLTDEGLLKIGEASPGGAGRNRTLGLEKLMAIEVPVPPLGIQQSFDCLQAEIAALKARHASIRIANAALLPAALERIFAERV